jgi:ABC-type lipoprotein export system ATPase subunit
MQGVEKIYRTAKLEFAALRGIDLAIGPGEMVAVVGRHHEGNRGHAHRPDLARG